MPLTYGIIQKSLIRIPVDGIQDIMTLNGDATHHVEPPGTNTKNNEFEDTMEKEKNTPAPPQMSPYIFTILLFGFGLWCFWDGWLTTDPEMLEHATFNKVLSVILLPWGICDFLKIRKRQKNKIESEDK